LQIYFVSCSLAFYTKYAQLNTNDSQYCLMCGQPCLQALSLTSDDEPEFVFEGLTLGPPDVKITQHCIQYANVKEN